MRLKTTCAAIALLACAAFPLLAAQVGSPPSTGFALPDGAWLSGLAAGNNIAVQSGLTATASGTQATAVQLGQTVELFQLDTVATNGDSVALPICAANPAGQQISIRNNGAASASVFASPLTNQISGTVDTLNGSATVALAVGPGAVATFRCIKTGQWAGAASGSGGLTSIASGACGAGANGAIVAGSTNSTGAFTVGAAATTQCSIGFSPVLGAAPKACNVTPINLTAAGNMTNTFIASKSTTAFVVQATQLNSAQFNYICQ